MTGLPYTYGTHAAYCAEYARQGVTAPPKRVQIVKQGLGYCGFISDAYTTAKGVECWTVHTTWPEAARFTVAVRNVRDCLAETCVCAQQKP